MHYALILGLGSNHDAERNIMMAEERLRSLFPAIIFSRTIRTAAVNTPHGTPDYLNAIAVAHTSLPYPALRSIMKGIERIQGRTPELKRKGLVPLDIDIMQYGDRQMKPDDWYRDFNILLLKELGL